MKVLVKKNFQFVDSIWTLHTQKNVQNLMYVSVTQFMYGVYKHYHIALLCRPLIEITQVPVTEDEYTPVDGDLMTMTKTMCKMIRKHYVRIMYMHVPVVALICVHCCVHMCILGFI